VSWHSPSPHIGQEQSSAHDSQFSEGLSQTSLPQQSPQSCGQFMQVSVSGLHMPLGQSGGHSQSAAQLSQFSPSSQTSLPQSGVQVQSAGQVVQVSPALASQVPFGQVGHGQSCGQESQLSPTVASQLSSPHCGWGGKSVFR